MKHAQRALAEANHWPILEPIEADGQVNPIALSKPVCIAGARHRVNLPLNSPQISRAHALFVADGDGVYLRDLASLNGVNVNNAPVREAVLHNGDVVRIGPFSFRCAQNFRDGAAEQPHAPAAELRLDDGAKVPLTSHTLVIGSREACDVHISDPKISPAHAVVFDRDGRWFIRDLRSAGGTRVNGQVVGEIKLEVGDTIQVGDTRLTFAPATGAQPQPQAPVDEIDASLSVGMDEVSLAADDSLIGQAKPAPAAPPRPAKPPAAEATEPPAPKPAEDSAIIPLIEDEEDKAKPSARPAPVPQPHPVEAEAAPPPSAAKPLLDDSSLIPISLEDSAAAVPSPAAQPKPAEPAEEHEKTPQPQPAVARSLLDDSSLIPVAPQSESSEAPTPPPAAPESPMPAPAAAAELSLSDSSVIPVTSEPQAPAAPQASTEESAEEPPHATAEELLEEPAGDSHSPISHPQSAMQPPSAYPGTVDRQKAEEIFSELLDELADNVEEVQTVWEDLKTTNPDEPPPRKRERIRRSK